MDRRTVFAAPEGNRSAKKLDVACGRRRGYHQAHEEHPLEKAMDDVLVAYGQNGEPIGPEQGFPLQLVVPGWQGINNVK
jgi:DMSO/TMAO reductase YedYZ molybdopterin-dependent catalytic subunit